MDSMGGASLSPIWIWLILFIVLIVIELLTIGLLTIWFAAGALGAIACAALGLPVPVQVVVFFGISIVLLFLLRPFAMNHFNNRRTATNVDSVIGKKGIVQEEIHNLQAQGRVEIDGLDWAARATNESDVIAVGATVEVDSVEGVKVKVHQIEV